MLKDLKELAKLKLAYDAIKEEYEQKSSALKAEMLKADATEVNDPDGILSIKLVSNDKREFSVEGVREVFKDRASLCIEEKVNTQKFDLLSKSSDGKKYVINESQQSQCFSMKKQQPSLTWDGLKVFQSKQNDKQ